jgi:hypothetical protein
VSAFPFLTTSDPPGSSEGTLDPLGLYQIADQLATRLVPAVRERMQRVRFLTVMAIGGLLTEGLDGDPEQPEAQPFLVWEWLVVQAIIRALSDDPEVWGVPGTPVVLRYVPSTTPAPTSLSNRSRTVRNDSPPAIPVIPCSHAASTSIPPSPSSTSTEASEKRTVWLLTGVCIE